MLLGHCSVESMKECTEKNFDWCEQGRQRGEALRLKYGNGMVGSGLEVPRAISEVVAKVRSFSWCTTSTHLIGILHITELICIPVPQVLILQAQD